MEIRKSIIEKIKNVAIVVLVLSTILLLYFYWGNGVAGVRLPIPGLHGGSGAQPVAVKDILRPERITLNFGGENYTVLDADEGFWENSEPDTPDFIQELTAMMSGEPVAASTISKGDFNEVMKARSIQADFAFPLPFAEYCAEYGFEQMQRLDVIENFTTIAYSEGSPESIFVCDKNVGKHYRLAVQNPSAGFGGLISYLEGRGNASYYPLRTYSGVDNDVMIPLDMQIVLPETRYSRFPGGENPDEDGVITDMAKEYFGDSFDFTRKLTEGNGDVIYMYRYGEKVLAIRDGVFEYSAAGDSTGGGGFFQALRAALDFLAKHDEPWRDEAKATWSGRGGVYLKKAERIQERNAFRFYFGMAHNGWNVYYEGSEPFVVEVTGQRVSYSKFDMIVCAGAAGMAPQAAAAPFDILVANHGYIFADLARGGRLGEAADIGMMDPFSAVMERVADVRTGYLRPSSWEASGALTPVWVFEIDNVEYYFDLYTGASAW